MMLQKVRNAYIVTMWQDKKQYRMQLDPELAAEARSRLTPKEDALLDAHMPVLLSTRTADLLLQEERWEQV